MAASKSISDPVCPFHWQERTAPSVFAQDPQFRTRADGKTTSQRMTEVREAAQAKGDNSTALFSLGKPTKTREEKLLAYKNFGVYSRAVPTDGKKEVM